MPFLKWLKRPFSKADPIPLILPINQQIKAWHKANRKMAWGISIEEFDSIESPPLLTEEDQNNGFAGVVLFYGFGSDGCGQADSIMSANVCWEYARTYKKKNMWQCEYIDFERTETARNIEGTGLGLAISKRLIELHNGIMGFESEYGKGSKFWFTIPI